MGEVEGAAVDAAVPAAGDRVERGRSQRVEWWIAALLAVAGGALVAVTTRNGVRLTPDSVSYLAMARRFSEDPSRFFNAGADPVVDQLNHWSPLAGLAIAWTSWLDSDPIQRGRLLAIASGAACAALGFVLVRRRTRVSVAVVASLLLVLSSQWLWAVGTVGSETEFFPLVLLALLAADVAIGSDRLRPWWLVVASAAAALSCTARFIGLSIVAAILVAAWVLCRRQDRWKAAAIVAVTGILPAIVWAGLYGSDRSPAFHPPTGRGPETLTTLSHWLAPSFLGFPSPLRALVALVVVVGLAVLLFLWIRAVWGAELVGPDRLIFLLVLTAAAYAGMLLVSSTFLDSEIAFTERIMFPLLLAAVVAIAVEVGRPAREGERPLVPFPVRRAASVAGLVLLALFAVDSVQAIRSGADDGYQLPRYTESETLAAAADLPEGTLIYSNGRIPLALFQDRVAQRSTWPDEQGAPTAEDLGPMLDDLRANDGVIVYFDTESGRSDLPALEDLEALSELEVVATFDDGAILRAS